MSSLTDMERRALRDVEAFLRAGEQALRTCATRARSDERLMEFAQALKHVERALDRVYEIHEYETVKTAKRKNLISEAQSKLWKEEE